jgi:hypothetical protein
MHGTPLYVWKNGKVLAVMAASASALCQEYVKLRHHGAQAARGGSVAASNSADSHGMSRLAEGQCLAIPEIEDPWQYLGILLCVEPEKVLVVTLDEHRPAWRAYEARFPER